MYFLGWKPNPSYLHNKDPGNGELTIFGKVLFMEVQMIGIVFEVYDDWDYL
jgi:hypothetical protein